MIFQFLLAPLVHSPGDCDDDHMMMMVMKTNGVMKINCVMTIIGVMIKDQ